MTYCEFRFVDNLGQNLVFACSTIFLGVFGGACCVVAIILEAWIGILLHKNRSRTTPSAKSKSSAGAGMDLQLAVRVVLFGFYIFAGLALSVVSIINWTSVVPDLCFSTFSLAVFAIFGSQQDILRVWKNGLCCCFVRSEQDSRRTASHVRTGSMDPGAKYHGPGGINGIAGNGAGHNPYWYRAGDKKDGMGGDMMADLATLHTRHTITQAGTTGSAMSPYNSHTDFQFQYESDVGLGLVGNANKGDRDNTKAGKKGKDTWWNGAGKQSNRPGTGGSAKQQRPGTADSNFGVESQSWYPDLGYAFDPEGTSHTADTDLEMDVAAGGPSHPYLQGQNPPLSKGGKGHANEHTRHSSATVPSEYIGTSPRTPQFIYYENEEAAQSLPQLVSSLSPSPLLPKETSSSKVKAQAEINTYGNSGYMFPPAHHAHAHAHAPAVNSRLYIEHRARSSTDTSASISNANDSQPYLLKAQPDVERQEQRDSTDGLPAYYLRQHSHSYMHSTDYRSSADSSIGAGARAAINAAIQTNNAVRGGDPRAGVCVGAGPGPAKLYDSDYPYTYDYEHSNMSTTALDHSFVPPPKSAFDRDTGGFQFISGRKRTGEGSGDSFQTNPSLYGGRAY